MKSIDTLVIKTNSDLQKWWRINAKQEKSIKVYEYKWSKPFKYELLSEDVTYWFYSIFCKWDVFQLGISFEIIQLWFISVMNVKLKLQKYFERFSAPK